METERQQGKGIEYYAALYRSIREGVASDEAALGIFAGMVYGMANHSEPGERSDRPEVNGYPATDRQVAYLRRLGVEPREGMSKEETSRLLDQLLENRQEAAGYQRFPAEAVE